MVNLLREMRLGVKDIIDSSVKATCAIMEREVTVPSSQVESTKRRLRNSGFMIIGTSEPIGRFRKVWFIRRGGF